MSKEEVRKEVEKILNSHNTDISSSSKRNTGAENPNPADEIKDLKVNVYSGKGQDKSSRGSGVYEKITTDQLHPLTKDSKGYSKVATQSKNLDGWDVADLDNLLDDLNNLPKDNINPVSGLKNLEDEGHEIIGGAEKTIKELRSNSMVKAAEAGVVFSASDIAEQEDKIVKDASQQLKATVQRKWGGKPTEFVEKTLDLSGVKLTDSDKLKVLGERFKLFCKHLHEYIHRKSDAEYIQKHGTKEQQEVYTAQERLLNNTSTKKGAKASIKSLVSSIFKEKYDNIPTEAEENIKKERNGKEFTKATKGGGIPFSLQ